MQQSDVLGVWASLRSSDPGILPSIAVSCINGDETRQRFYTHEEMVSYPECCKIVETDISLKCRSMLIMAKYSWSMGGMKSLGVRENSDTASGFNSSRYDVPLIVLMSDTNSG